MTTTDYRLPNAVIPLDYDIDLDASPRRAGFFGVLGLTARVAEPTNTIELHARGLKIDAVTARLGKKRLKGRVLAHPDRETIELIFDEPLRKGKVELRMAFKGKLNPNMHGLYLAKDGRDRAIVSQCEATDARAIFPCFDEPDFKATLRWTVRTDPGLDVVTNGVLESKRKAKGRSVHRFKKTRVISSYLAAITIGKLESTAAKKAGRIPCRVWCVPGKLDQTAFAEEVTSRVLPWYENYFGQKYNYQKLDQVAVPGFDAGAMENVGAVFYRQSLLLMKPGVTSWSSQKRIAEVIAHEIAHMWFGNLVTMKWWDDLWLNEAFATWIAYKAVDDWQPEWRMWDDYLRSREIALAADSLVNTHPIYTAVNSPAEATELFDVITYEKGCSVLRMAESFLGEEPFRSAIRNYMTAFKNDNATGSDLWNALTDASGEKVDELMKSWVEQPGFPLVSMKREQRDGKTLLHFEQRRFFASPSEMRRDRNQTWHIPLVIRYDDGGTIKTHRELLTSRRQTIELPGDEPRWIFPNADAAGFFRLDLNAESVRALLDHGLAALTPGERANLIEDQWALVRNGHSDIERFMEVLNAFKDEDDHIVTRAIAGRLAYLDTYLVRDQDRDYLAGYTRRLFEQQLVDLGWDARANELPERSVRRATVIGTVGDVGRDEMVLDEAERRLEIEIDDPAAIEPNLAGVVVALAAQRGDRKRLDRYIETYVARRKQGATPELQTRYIGALGSFEKKPAITQILELLLGDTIPQEQLRSVLAQLLASRTANRLAWTFLKKNWATISPQVGAMGISRLVEVTGLLPVDLRDEVESFFTSNPVDEAKRALQLALETMDLRRELSKRESANLGDWLRRGVSRDSPN